MEYIPVLIMLGLGAIVGVAATTLSNFIGPRVPHPMKDQPFECGVPGVGNARQRVSVRFYLIAILFLLFDVESVFFYPFALTFKKYLAVSSFIVWEMSVFVGILLIGYLYILWKGALEWD